jgi:hypothetical protein
MGMGTGIENATVIHVPLTRRHSLAMYQPSAMPPQLAALGHDISQRGITATALYSNSCTVNSARRFLFHHPGDAPLAGFDLPQPRETRGRGPRPNVGMDRRRRPPSAPERRVRP